jgi:hypothetical protein
MQHRTLPLSPLFLLFFFSSRCFNFSNQGLVLIETNIEASRRQTRQQARQQQHDMTAMQ